MLPISAVVSSDRDAIRATNPDHHVRHLGDVLAVAPPVVIPTCMHLPASRESVPCARRLVTEALPRHLALLSGGDPCDRAVVEDLMDSLSLMTSELVTNAVTHAPTDERMVEVVLWRADGMLWLAVSDCGEVFPVRHRADPVAQAFPDPEDDHGRGLYLVEALADFWDVVPRPTVGKSVVAALRLP